MSMSINNNFSQFVAIVSVCTLCYYNSASCGLVFDDISAVKDNKDLRPSTPLKNIFLNDFWGTPMRKEQSHKSYRPLTVLTFRWNYLVHQLEPAGFHVVNVILHVIVCILFKRACRQLWLGIVGGGGEKQMSFVAALLFAVHPVHTEAVTGVVGRAELLSSIFFLLAFLCYAKATKPVRTTRWLSLNYFGVCLLCSMLCKEQGITIAGICAAYEVFIVQQIRPIQIFEFIKNLFEEKKKKTSTNHEYTTPGLNVTFITRLIFLVSISFMLLVGRLYVMGSQLPVFTRFDNPASAAETPSRQLTFSYLIYLNCWLLVFPCNLCCDWTMGTIPLIEGFYDIRNITTLVTFLGLFTIGLNGIITKNQAHSKIIIMSLAWMCFPFLPASNLFFPVGFVVAERVLYMPSMGFCMLLAYGLYNISTKNKRFAEVILCVLLLCHGFKTFTRNKDWQTEYSLFMSGLKVNSRNAKLFNNVGHALENEGKYLDALIYFQKAVTIQGDDIGAYINVGRTYNHLKMYKEAEESYLKAKSLFPKVKPGESYQARIAPNHLNVFINLANLISKNQTRLEEADHLYKQAISMRADYVQAYINRGDILMKLNKTNEAQEVYEKALLYDNENADIYYNLGVVFLEQGKSSQANVYFNKAIELAPDHEQALLNSAILLQELGGKEYRTISRERLFKILKKDQNNERVFFNLGMLAMDENNFEDAENYFKRAIHIKTDFRSALFNLALMLADANRPLDAVPFLNQLIRYHPDHIKGLILLGDIYINHMKDLDAAEICYRSILRYEPHNIQGLHNLCVVFVERKKLAKAMNCLNYVHHMAPAEEYILKHLKIVQVRLAKIKKLPDSLPEKQLALSDNDSDEFSLQNLTAAPSTNLSSNSKPARPSL
ncbi:protein O-mannosyl-transferase Tmtc3 [Episyrphus balteatus]|uniref:protein O-mannosyl-transferase Tmtc3 n=1 Tax=Episyrphus balteatus TaxID=286459 RepID=UPI002486AA57|nr:protein O-mannosyl-transferase Tmtc3 [Episyrphus balteatus]